jgi:hypothetical protein
MKTVMSIKKHRSSIAKAIHKQKRMIEKKVNRKENELIPKSGFGRFLHQLGLIIDKVFK